MTILVRKEGGSERQGKDRRRVKQGVTQHESEIELEHEAEQGSITMSSC